MKIRKLSLALLVSMLIFSASLAQAADYKTKLTLTITAPAAYDEAYELTVPGETAIKKSGWNLLGNITAKYSGQKDGFDPSKKLVVTATSSNDFKLKASGVTDTVSYFVATTSDDTGPITTFEFTAAEINAKGSGNAFVGTSKPIGVNVEDYSKKAAGDYEDEITYNVEVKAAATTRTVTWNSFDGASATTLTKDGVTLTAGSISSTQYNNFKGGGSFSVASGNFTNIEITAPNNISGEGWSGDSAKKTWTGKAASVSFSGETDSNTKIVFTIEE